MLKIDCEGCEWDFFDTLSDENLAAFDQIVIEIHNILFEDFHNTQ
jgi:hypothetical protein